MTSKNCACTFLWYLNLRCKSKYLVLLRKGTRPMDINKIVEIKFNEIDENLKQMLESMLEIFSIKDTVQYLLFLKEEEEEQKANAENSGATN